MTDSPTLSFPRDIFAVLSPGPFLQAHLSPQVAAQSSIRPNGRDPREFRTPNINAGSLTHCSGSAVVRLGDTAVVCGIRGEILLAEDIPNPPPATATQPNRATSLADGDEVLALGLLVPNIELATGSTPQNLPGSPPSTIAQSLTARLLSLLHNTTLVDPAQLRIMYQPPAPAEDDVDADSPQSERVIAYWTLYIDILFISLDGNAFDAAWGAMLAAFQDTKLPKAWWDPEIESIVCSDAVADARVIQLRGLPVPASFGVFDPKGGDARRFTEHSAEEDEERTTWLLSDLDAFEEGLCPEKATIVIDCSEGVKQKIKRIEKNGGGSIGREAMRELVSRAEARWKEWRDILQTPGT